MAAGTEFYNPTRRYKHFRPREAALALKVQGTPTNNATIGLFNNSTGPRVLVVRDFTLNGTAADVVSMSYAAGAVGTSQGLVRSMLPSQAAPSGLLASIDTATAYPGDYQLALSSLGIFIWQHDFPFAVVEPNWSLVFQCNTAAHALTCSVVWEAISIDELDWFW
jgi:hypothetical protein